MKLFLCSSTITEELLPEFENFADRPAKGMRVAFIPDAAYGEEGNAWLAEEQIYQKETLGFDLEVFELEKQTPDTIKELLEFDALFVAGGLIVDLHRVMHQSGFAELFTDMLEKGVIYIGSSASSMIMSRSQDAAVWYVGEAEPEAKDIEGFGLIDFQFYPHYDEKFQDQILEQIDPYLEYWFLKDGDALAISDNEIKIFGNGVMVIKPKD